MAEKDTAVTPMMRQFYDLKAKHPDAVLLFRCGDFYETYCSDAIVASEILGITLTKRSNGKSDASKAIEMAGFPFHALDNYLPKLVRAGKRVAICVRSRTSSRRICMRFFRIRIFMPHR